MNQILLSPKAYSVIYKQEVLGEASTIPLKGSFDAFFSLTAKVKALIIWKYKKNDKKSPKKISIVEVFQKPRLM